MFFSLCVSNLIKIWPQVTDSQHFIDFQDGSGGHFGKWRHTFACVFHKLYMPFSVNVPKFMKIRDKWPTYSVSSIFKMAAAEMVDFWSNCHFSLIKVPRKMPILGTPLLPSGRFNDFNPRIV
jgi:hypothetical protein